MDALSSVQWRATVYRAAESHHGVPHSPMNQAQRVDWYNSRTASPVIGGI